MQLGRGPDFSWSATAAAGTDIVDQYVETLCGGDTSYVFNGNCVAMTPFDAGMLGPGPGPPAGPVTFHQTVHGPVSGYAKSDGQRVAISTKRRWRVQQSHADSHRTLARCCYTSPSLPAS